MGRSVSTPPNATLVEYDHHVFTDEWDYEEYKKTFVETLKTLYPSLTECEEWLGREDLAVLENRLAYFGLSEYCGVIALWAVPKDEVLGECWLENIRKGFGSFGTLQRMGTFSNGNAVYEKKEVVTRE